MSRADHVHFVRLALVVSCCIGASAAFAQEPEPPNETTQGPLLEGQPHSLMPGVDEVAAAIATMGGRHWLGRRTPHPSVVERPIQPILARSERWPIAIHGVPEQLARAQALLPELDAFAAYMVRGGWAVPMPDGGLGGTSDFDIYLVRQEQGALAHSDGPIPWSFHDAVSSHAVVDADLVADDLAVCGAQAYAQALLLQLDPAEARPWRRALATYLTWMWSGRFGCRGSVYQQQEQPERGWITGAAGEGEGGGLMLAMLDARHGSGTGVFVREIVQLARQRTWDGTELRAGPDLWQATDVALDRGGERLHDVMTEFAVARWFLGDRDRHGFFPALRGLGPSASPPEMASVSLAELPEHTRVGPEIGVYGSQFARVNVRGAPENSRLRVWLRGEYGVEWALTASRLAADGSELARLAAPPRRGDRRSYLPVELDAETTDVMVSITNLAHRLPDADDPNPSARAFRLIFALVEEGAE